MKEELTPQKSAEQAYINMINEANEYIDSAEFTNDWVEFERSIEKALRIVSAKKFATWLAITNHEKHVRKLKGLLSDAQEIVEEIEGDFEDL